MNLPVFLTLALGLVAAIIGTGLLRPTGRADASRHRWIGALVLALSLGCFLMAVSPLKAVVTWLAVVSLAGIVLVVGRGIRG